VRISDVIRTKEIRAMKHTDTIIIGGGQAGLAMSRCLTDQSIDHVVLERGRIGERWRSERWDSLRLLSPNWHSRLPRWDYHGEKPDEFMTVPHYLRHLERYAQSFAAPVQSGTTVRAVERLYADRYRVTTDNGVWAASNVVIATGFCDRPRVPELGAALPPDIIQLVPSHYRNPGQVPEGDVLVVGASATGLQLAEELAAAGRGVTLAVGTHIRTPRRYRGRDIIFWMDAIGAFAAAADSREERKTPPPQLVGSPENRDLDLGTLQGKGVRLTGRAVGVQGNRVVFADDLEEKIAAANAQMTQLLAKIDGFIASAGSGEHAPVSDPPAPIEPNPAPLTIDVRADRIRTVIWATGYERRYPWLKIPALDGRGEIRHTGGVTPFPGLYVLGIRFQRRKDSNLIDGVGRDAEFLSRHLAERTFKRAA
jgi:putative flavoprotein involved in K+ transport